MRLVRPATPLSWGALIDMKEEPSRGIQLQQLAVGPSARTVVAGPADLPEWARETVTRNGCFPLMVWQRRSTQPHKPIH